MAIDAAAEIAHSSEFCIPRPAWAEARESSSTLALLLREDPIVYVDLHVTDGAEFQHDVAVLVSPGAAFVSSVCGVVVVLAILGGVGFMIVAVLWPIITLIARLAG